MFEAQGASVDEKRKTEKTNLQKRFYTPFIFIEATII